MSNHWLCWPVPKDSVKADINTPGGRHEFCVLILDETPVDPHPPHINWTHSGVSEGDARQLQTLATIDRIAEQLSGGISRQFSELVSTHMQEFAKKIGGEATITRRS